MKVYAKDVMEYKNNNPELGLWTIGKHFGISRQRVHQIIKENTSPIECDERERKILLLRSDNPCMTLRELQEKADATSQFVTTTLKSNSLPTKGVNANRVKVLKLRHDNPSIRIEDIAKRVGIGVSYVSYLLNEYRAQKHYCEVCGSLITYQRSKNNTHTCGNKCQRLYKHYKYHCIICNKPLINGNTGKQRTCGSKDCHRIYMKKRRIIDGKVVFP